MTIIMRIVWCMFTLGIFATLFLCPAVFAKGIMSIEYSELSAKEKLICKIPILNIVKAERLYTGRISTIGLSMLSLILSLIIRLIVVYTIPRVFVVQVITVVWFVLSLIAVLVTNMILVYMVISDANTRDFGGKLAYAIFFPLGMYYVGTFLPNEMKNLAKEEATFK